MPLGKRRIVVIFIVAGGHASIDLRALSFYIEIIWKEEEPGHAGLLSATWNENLAYLHICVICPHQAPGFGRKLGRSSESGIYNELLGAQSS